MSRAWYSYKRGGADVTLPESYLYTGIRPTCNAGRIVCAIYGIFAGINPAFISTNIQNYIATGQATGLAQPTLPFGAKKYVYFLPS